MASIELVRHIVVDAGVVAAYHLSFAKTNDNGTTDYYDGYSSTKDINGNWTTKNVGISGETLRVYPNQPIEKRGQSIFISLGRRYVRHFNQAQRRSGTLPSMPPAPAASSGTWGSGRPGGIMCWRGWDEEKEWRRQG
jgi:hypothetical protein